MSEIIKENSDSEYDPEKNCTVGEINGQHARKFKRILENSERFAVGTIIINYGLLAWILLAIYASNARVAIIEDTRFTREDAAVQASRDREARHVLQREIELRLNEALGEIKAEIRRANEK